MEIAGAIAEGRAAMEGLWTVDAPVPVLYIDGEMDPRDLQERGRALGWNETILTSKLFFDEERMSGFLNLADPAQRNHITDKAIELGIKLVVRDNIYSLIFGIDHNRESDWAPINRWLIDLRSLGKR